MKIAIVAVGKLRDARLRGVIDEYAKRIGKYAKYEEVEIRDGSADAVAERIERVLPERSRVVALEVDGDGLSSEGLARFVERAEADGVGTLAWLIGGAEGLPSRASKAADRRISLSPMTLPHRLARAVLAEQIYRAFTILRGEPYPR